MIELGTHITYTHQAAVVRKKDGKWKFDRKQNGNVPRELYENPNGLFWIGFTPYNTARPRRVHAAGRDAALEARSRPR